MASKLDFQTTYESLMRADSNYKFTIGGLYGGSVSGILNAPMPIAGNNEFESAKAALSNLPLVGKVFEAGQSISDVAKISGNDTIMSLEQTRKVWQESRIPQLSIEATFWNVDSHGDAKDKPVNKVKRLYTALFPTRGSDEFLITAPLGYKFSSEKGNAVGTLNLTIGRWFRASGLVMADANFTPSLEVSSDGTPLYFTGSVTLEPFRMITFDEYSAWFRTPKVRPKHNSDDKVSKAQLTDLDSAIAGIKKQADDFLGQFGKA